LGKDDFVLEEDRRPQTITYFTRDTDLPLTLGLLVDTSESQRRVLDQERTASHNFLDDMLRENDQAFVIHFDREVGTALKFVLRLFDFFAFFGETDPSSLLKLAPRMRIPASC
jgi:hypothetical protein